MEEMMKYINANVEALIANHIAKCEETGAMPEQHKGFIRDMWHRYAKIADTRRNAKLVAELEAKGGFVDIDAYKGYCRVYFDDGSMKRIRQATAEALINLGVVTQNYDY